MPTRKKKKKKARPKKKTRAPENKSMKKKVSKKSGAWVHDPVNPGRIKQNPDFEDMQAENQCQNQWE